MPCPLASDIIGSLMQTVVFPLPEVSNRIFVNIPEPAGITSPEKEKPRTIPNSEVDTSKLFSSAKPPSAPITVIISAESSMVNWNPPMSSSLYTNISTESRPKFPKVSSTEPYIQLPSSMVASGS